MSIFGGIGSVVGADIIAYVKLSGADTFNRDLDKINKNAELFSGTLNKTMNIALGAGAAAFLASSAAAITFESSFAGVLKTTDGLTDSLGNINAEGVALSQEFRKLALEIPVSVNELNRIGELGGQLGIAKGDLITFTEVIAKLGATTDLSYEQGATAIAQFVNVTKTVVPAGISVQSQIERIASTLVDLGNKSVATESGILEFAQRLAGAGATVGLTQEQILSLGAALSSVGLNAEMGGTAFSRLLLNMKTAVEKGSSSLEVFSRVAGVDFKEAFETDAAGAITKFIEGMHSISKNGGSVINVLGELGINEARMTSALLLASNAGELLNKTFEIGEAAYKSNSALSDEFAKRTATTSAQLTLLKNSVVDGAIELGQTLLPSINSVLGALNKSPETVKAFISSFGEVAIIAGSLAGLYKVGTGLVTLVTSMNPLVLTLTGIAAGITAILTLVKSNELKKLAKIEGVSDSVKQLITLSEQYKELYETKNKSIEQNELLSETNNKLLEIFRATVGPVKEIGGNIGILTRRALEFKKENLSMAMSMLGKRIEGLNVQALNKNFQVSQTEMEKLNKQYDLMGEELKQVDMMLTVHSVNVEASTQKMATSEVQVAATKEELKKYHEELTNGVEFLGEILTAQIQVTDGLALAKNAVDLGRQSFIGMNAETVNAKNHSIGLSTATTELNGQVRTLGDGLNLSTGQLTHYKETQKDARDATNAYNEILNQFIGKAGSAGEVMGVFADYLFSAHEATRKLKDGTTETFIAFDTLSLASGLLGIAFNALFAEGEKWSWEEYATEIYGAGSAVLDVNENLDALNDEFGQYDLIDQYTAKSAGLTAAMILLNAMNQEGSEKWKAVRDELALTAEQIRILTESFTFLDQVLSEQSAYLTTNIAEAWTYYGGVIPDEKMTAWLALLAENTAKLQEQSGLLAVGSQAWKDNEAAINANNYTIGLLNGTWSDFAGYVEYAGLSIDEAERFLLRLGLTAEQVDEALKTLGYDCTNTGDSLYSTGQKAKQAAEDISIVGQKADETAEATARINKEMDYWQGQLLIINAEQEELTRQLDAATLALNTQVSALESNIAEWQKQIATIDEELNWNIDLTPPTLEEIGGIISGLNTDIASMQSQIAKIDFDILTLKVEHQQAIDDYITSINILISKAGELQIAWGDSTDTTISNFETLFGSGAESWTNKALAAIEQLKYFKIDLDTTDADESIAGTIVKMQEYLGTLAPGSPAYIAAQESLGNLITQYNTLGTAFSTEVGVNFNNTQAMTGIEEIDTAYADQVTALETEKAMVTVNLSDYRATLIYMGWEYQDRMNQLTAMKATAQINITTAQGQITTLTNDYNALKTSIESRQVVLNANASQASQAIYYLKQELANLTANPYVVTITANSTLPSQHTGGMLYHSGGLVAHNGMMLGQYGTLREVPFTGLEGEYVLNPNIGRKFGEAALGAFNVSGNPAVLGAESRQTQPTVELKPEFTIMNAAPETFVTWTDKYIHPRIRDNDDRQIKSDRFK